MVLSVSKTFLKLKDLILEKNTLQEQVCDKTFFSNSFLLLFLKVILPNFASFFKVVKMKTINEHLCSQVNIHEEKLCGITDELNNTW